MTQLIRVLIADDHPVILYGTDKALAHHPTIEVIGQARNSTEAVELLERAPCDVIITDLAMPGGAYGDGLPFISYLTRKFPRLRIIVLTALENAALLKELQRYGVKAVLNKTDGTKHIAQAVLRVMRDETYYGPNMAAMLSNVYLPLDSTRSPQDLSKRELEVMRLFCQGLSVKDIASTLNRSVKTISTQKNTAMRKKGLKNDCEVYTWCMCNGMVTMPEYASANGAEPERAASADASPPPAPEQC